MRCSCCCRGLRWCAAHRLTPAEARPGPSRRFLATPDHPPWAVLLTAPARGLVPPERAGRPGRELCGRRGRRTRWNRVPRRSAAGRAEARPDRRAPVPRSGRAPGADAGGSPGCPDRPARRAPYASCRRRTGPGGRWRRPRGAGRRAPPARVRRAEPRRPGAAGPPWGEVRSAARRGARGFPRAGRRVPWRRQVPSGWRRWVPSWGRWWGRAPRTWPGRRASRSWPDAVPEGGAPVRRAAGRRSAKAPADGGGRPVRTRPGRRPPARLPGRNLPPMSLLRCVGRTDRRTAGYRPRPGIRPAAGPGRSGAVRRARRRRTGPRTPSRAAAPRPRVARAGSGEELSGDRCRRRSPPGRSGHGKTA